MKRDFDLLRDILLDVESNKKINDLYLPRVDGYEEETIFYHVKLLGDAGFLDVYNASSKSGIDYRAQSMTYSGHEFLDNIRNSSVWEKTKKTGLEKAGTLTFEIIKSISSALIKEMIK